MGFYQVLEFFDESRIEIAAQALGIAQGAFDRAVAYAKSREQFGKKIAAFQVDAAQARRHGDQDRARAADHLQGGLELRPGADRPEARPPWPSSTPRAIAVEVADEAIQILGGYGYMTEFEVERFYRDAKITEIYEGTKEIQKNTIAAAVLGKLR